MFNNKQIENLSIEFQNIKIKSTNEMVNLMK